ncbi:MAG: hypothetical protein M1812_007007 [Candelaria pacifica]|nr:MAG: hypothetical protein M1812_007007 [Candelaria pacifica]
MSGGMSGPPLEVIASWPAPNYVDPITRGPTAIIVGCVCLGVSMIVLPLRYYTRLRISKNFGADDILLGIGMIFVLAFTGLVFHAYLLGFWSRHLWDVPLPNLVLSIKHTMAAGLTYLIASTLVKLSFLFLYRRILDHTIWKHYNRVLTAIITFVILVPCFYFPLIIFQCRPIRAYWDITPTYEFYCLPRVFPDASLSIVSAILDFVVVMLPIPILWRMSLPLKQRVGMCCLFGAGLLICVVGSLRSYYLFFVLYHTWDATWYVMDVYITTMLEIYVGVICASIPALRPLAGKYWPQARRLLPSHTRDLSPLVSTSDRSGQASPKRSSHTQISDFELAGESKPVSRDGPLAENKAREGLRGGGTCAASFEKEPEFCTSAI